VRGIRSGDSAKSIRFRENCKLCTETMPDGRIPQQIMKYQPKGHRFIYRPRKMMEGNMKPEQA
jgi:hypothetical protein